MEEVWERNGRRLNCNGLVLRGHGGFTGFMITMCSAAPHGPASLIVAQLRDWRKSPEAVTEMSVDCWIGNLTSLKQKSWSNTPLCTAGSKKDRAAVFPTGGRRRGEGGYQLKGEVTVRLAHQLPGKPAAGAEGKHVGGYWLSPIIKRIGQSCG